MPCNFFVQLWGQLDEHASIRRDSNSQRRFSPKLARQRLPWVRVWNRKQRQRRCGPQPNVAAAYLFGVVATQAGGARRLRRFRVAQSREVRYCLCFRKAQMVKRPEGRAPAQIIVAALNTNAATPLRWITNQT